MATGGGGSEAFYTHFSVAAFTDFWIAQS